MKVSLGSVSENLQVSNLQVHPALYSPLFHKEIEAHEIVAFISQNPCDTFPPLE